jgi:micrococcal nuclease
MRRGTVLLTVLALCLPFCFGGDASSAKPKLPVIPPPDFSKLPSFPVLRVIDGDTIVIVAGPGVADDTVTVRLIGVDTPETVHPSKPVQAYGKEASAFTTNLLKGESVYLVFEGEKPETDKYGRTLAYVYRAPDGLFVNAEIVRQGYGHAYVAFPFKYLDQFRALETFARASEKGLWAPGVAKGATPPPVDTPVVAPPPRRPEPREEPKADIIVYVTRTGAKYHRAGCRYLRRSSIPMKLEDAKKRYTPCSVCRPPQ